MKILTTGLSGVVIVEPEVHRDGRGFFMETYREQAYSEAGIAVRFVQDNHSLSRIKGTVRGMHYQLLPKAQSKLVHVVAGSIRNFVVDIRRGSPQFLRWTEVELSAENHRQLFIPKGFANGFVTESDDTEVVYKVDEYYAPECDRVFAWNDPQIGIKWMVDNPILSDRDRNAPTCERAENNFTYESD